MLIDWSDQWEVGEKRIDAEHQETVWLINRLHNAVEGNEASEIVLKIMASLVDLTEEHFAYEDRLMFSVKYPKSSGHRKQHQYLLKSLKSLREDVIASEVHIGSINALNSWFILHTSEEDLPLGRFLQSTQPSEAAQEPENKVSIDRLADIKDRLLHSNTPKFSPPTWSDIEWLVAEIDRMRSR